VKHYEIGGRVVGTLCDDGVYRTYRGSRHFCVKHQGWGLQAWIYEDIKSVGSAVHVVTDRATYAAPIDLWRRFGVPDTLRAEDGKQIFLHKNHFTKHTADAPSERGGGE
jgi:hypothetical protein